jgi:hypothetical protein
MKGELGTFNFDFTYIHTEDTDMQYINMRGRKCIWSTSKKITLTLNVKWKQLSVHIAWFFFFNISAVLHTKPTAERYSTIFVLTQNDVIYENTYWQLKCMQLIALVGECA